MPYAPDFDAFSKAGKRLAELHVDYAIPQNTFQRQQCEDVYSSNNSKGSSVVKRSKPFLLKSPVAMADRLPFTTGSVIPQSGVYQVVHKRHRLPHEVILLAGESLPRCAKCQDEVTFKLVYAARENGDRRRQVVLHELPVIEDSDEQALQAV